MFELQGVVTDRKGVFPYSGLRVLGFIHITNGSLLFLLGVLDLTLTMITYDEGIAQYGKQYDRIVTLTVTSTPIWAGMWFILTGSLGTCFSRAKAHTLQFFKLTFLVLNILCAVFFGPACAAVSGLISIERHVLDPNRYNWLLTLLLCFIAILEILIATATSAITCCCSPLKGTQVNILINSKPRQEPQLRQLQLQQQNRKEPLPQKYYQNTKPIERHVPPPRTYKEDRNKVAPLTEPSYIKNDPFVPIQEPRVVQHQTGSQPRTKLETEPRRKVNDVDNNTIENFPSQVIEMQPHLNQPETEQPHRYLPEREQPHSYQPESEQPHHYQPENEQPHLYQPENEHPRYPAEEGPEEEFEHDGFGDLNSKQPNSYGTLKKWAVPSW